MHGTRPPSSPKPNPRAISIRIARDPNDLMLVTAIRSAVYLAEQDCPIEEEFDGNDLVAAHFIGFVGKEPAGCLRVRFFGEFAKVERLAVRHQFRRSRVSFKLVQASVDYIRRKGFQKIYGQAQDRLVDFWAHFGAKPLGHNRKITFSDFSYTEMVLELEPGPDAITLDSDPYVIIRPKATGTGPAFSTSPPVARRPLPFAQRPSLEHMISNRKMPASIDDDPPILVCADLQTEYLTEGRSHVISDAEAITSRCLDLMSLWRDNLWPIMHLKRIAQAAWFNPRRT